MDYTEGRNRAVMMVIWITVTDAVRTVPLSNRIGLAFHHRIMSLHVF